MYTYSLVQWFLFFYIYCFLGWVWESCYVSAKKHKWVNRGFMHGPFLPIYGSGAIMVLIATLPVKEHLVLVFIFGMIGATVLEYFTGAAMEQMFHVRYWDYSSKPFNLNGHICLLSSLAWGIFSVLMETVFHKPIEAFVFALPQTVMEMVTLGLTVGIAVDLTQSFNEAMDLKHMLMNMTENSEEIQRVKKRLEAVITILDDQTKELREKVGESRQVLSEKLADEKKKYEEKSIQLKQSAQKLLELNAEKGREMQGTVLNTLSEKISSYAESAAAFLKDQEGSLGSEADKFVGELKGIKQTISKVQKNLSLINNKQSFHSIKMLQRNPDAISKKYTEALKKLQALADKRE